MRYYIELHNRDNQYTGLIHQGDPAAGRTLTGRLQLGPQANVEIKGRQVTLRDVLAALLADNQAQLQTLFDEPGQLAIGQYLYTQLFGDRRAHELRQSGSDEVYLWIVTDD